MKHIKTIEEKFQKLDDISHVLKRPGRYIGSINPHSASTFVFSEIEKKMVKEEITWCPGLIKVFDEVISNSVDFSKISDGKHLTTIKVEINKETGEISVYDDGGIAVVKHKEHDQWIPELIFELKAGSNFSDEDDSITTGQNGEGAALTLIFSKEFKVKTCDSTNQFEQIHFENGRKKTEPKIKASEKHFTQISWTPDYEKFNLSSGLDEGNYKKLVKRVYDVAGCNPELKIYLNGTQIKIKSFEDYISLFVDDFVFDENQHWKIGITQAHEGFSHISFVNGTETIIGGTHISYVADQIVSKLRDYLKKKHKVDVKPSDIKNQLFLFINATIVKPRYSSQTKEDLITEIKSFQTSWECSDKFIKKLIGSPIIQSVLDWIAAKEQAEQLAQLRKLNKNLDKTDPKKVLNFHDASSKNRAETSLLIVEGISAMSGVLSGRNPKFNAVFPLKGKPINVYEMDVKELIENKEFKNILTITGLQLGTKVKTISDIRFNQIILTTDSDRDGYGIRGLLLNMFYKFWPELFKLGVIYILNTPIVKVSQGKKTISFYDEVEFDKWKEQHKTENFTSKFYKGLGTSSSKEWKEYFSIESIKQNLVQLTIESEEDEKIFHLLFSKAKGMTDQRKDWLQLSELN